MAATEARTDRNGAADTHEQIRDLREQVEALMRERVTPVLTGAADRAEAVAHRIGDMAHDKTDAVARRVQEAPLTALLIAAAAGYIIGRVTR